MRSGYLLQRNYRMYKRKIPSPHFLFALVACTVIGLVACSDEESPVVPEPEPIVIANGWVALGVLGKDLAGYSVHMMFSDEDRFILLQWGSSGSGPETLLAGRIVERDGSRMRLSWTGGTKSRRNPEGWVRLDTSNGNLFLSMISRKATGSGSTPFPTGNWASGSWPGGSGTLSIQADGNWSLATSATVSGTWEYGTYGDSASLASMPGMDGPFARYLAGRKHLTAVSSLHLVDGDSTNAWFDQIGDGSLVRFGPIIPD